jgi:hypothetical protein
MLDTDAASELVANGELELGVVVITQILTTPGVELVGPLPSEIQFYTMFFAGISANSKIRGRRPRLDQIPRWSSGRSRSSIPRLWNRAEPLLFATVVGSHKWAPVEHTGGADNIGTW